MGASGHAYDISLGPDRLAIIFVGQLREPERALMIVRAADDDLVGVGLAAVRNRKRAEGGSRCSRSGELQKDYFHGHEAARIDAELPLPRSHFYAIEMTAG